MAAAKKTIRKKPATRRKAEPKKDHIEKAIDLIKWVDNPFKLFAVILLSITFFVGYFAWDSRQVILHAISESNSMPKIKDHEHLMPLANALMRDIDAETILIYSTNLATNSRTSVVALGKTGRNAELEGTMTGLFTSNAPHNQAVISMLSGEVACDDLVVSSKTSEWEARQGVKYVCRGSVPPEVGKFAGYMTVGFKEAPKDLMSIKTRITFTNNQMAK